MLNKEFYKEKLEDLLIRGLTHDICYYKKQQVPLCKETCDFKHCTECNYYFKEWLNAEHVEPYKLSLFAKSLLEEVEKRGFNYITLDVEGLFVHAYKPDLKKGLWYTECGYEDITLFINCFPFITGHETEPYSIKHILDSCEVIDDE